MINVLSYVDCCQVLRDTFSQSENLTNKCEGFLSLYVILTLILYSLNVLASSFHQLFPG